MGLCKGNTVVKIYVEDTQVSLAITPDSIASLFSYNTSLRVWTPYYSWFALNGLSLTALSHRLSPMELTSDCAIFLLPQDQPWPIPQSLWPIPSKPLALFWTKLFPMPNLFYFDPLLARFPNRYTTHIGPNDWYP